MPPRTPLTMRATVVLDLLALAPAVAALAPSEVGVDIALGVERQPRRDALDDDGELRTVGLAGGQKTKHLQAIVLASASSPRCDRPARSGLSRCGPELSPKSQRGEPGCRRCRSCRRAPAHRAPARGSRRRHRSDPRLSRGHPRWHRAGRARCPTSGCSPRPDCFAGEYPVARGKLRRRPGDAPAQPGPRARSWWPATRCRTPPPWEFCAGPRRRHDRRTRSRCRRRRSGGRQAACE